MNNQKPQKPTLTGQRFKTRKRGLCPLIIIPSTALKASHNSWIPCALCFLFFSPTRWKGEIWPYSVSRKYRTRLEPNWHWFGRSCKVPGCLWRQAWLPPICRDTLWHLGGWRNAGWVGVDVNKVKLKWKPLMQVAFFCLCSPRWDFIWRHDPHGLLPLYGTRRPGDNASICSGIRQVVTEQFACLKNLV